MAHVLMRALLLSLLTTSAAVSASPFKFSYGGQLSNEKGPVTGPVKIELKFYRVSAGGDAVPVTPVIFENVPLQDGVFQVEITQLTAEELTTVFDGSNSVYIEVTDRTNNLTYPRQQVNSVPFALKVPVDESTLSYNAQGKLTVNSIPVASISGLGNSASLNTGTQAGNIIKLDSNGKIPAIDGSQITNVTLPNTGTAGTYTKVTTDAAGRVTSGTSLTSSDIPLAAPAAIGSTTPNTGAFTTLTTTGNVGIGTTAPGAQLDVYGSLNGGIGSRNINTSNAANAYALSRLTNDTGNSLVSFLNSSGRSTDGGANNATIRNDAGALLLQSQAGTTGGIYIAPASGNVGIGTTAPGAKLEVAGASGTDGIKFPDATLQTSAAIITRWVNTGASTIGATGAAPTKGTTTTDQVSWRRVGDTMEMRWRYVQSTAGTAGSGTYLLTIPGGYSIDTTKLPVPSSAYNYMAGVGTIRGYVAGGGLCIGPVYAYNATQLFAELICWDGGVLGGSWGSTFLPLYSSSSSFTLDASFPVSGW